MFRRAASSILWETVALGDTPVQFRRLAPGPDGPLWGVRDTEQWRDKIYLGGFSAGCSATRNRKSSLLVPGDLLIAAREQGDALNVLNTVVSYWPP
ncbi:MAG: hypothetical protein ABR608_05395 [Pseudonocardiaceae bacterium]